MEQPSGEMMRLEKILEAFDGAERLESKRQQAKNNMKGKS